MRGQQHSPCYTYLHDRFLVETVQFVLYGVPRKMSISQYIRMLDTEDDNLIYQATQALTDEHSLGKLLDAVHNADSVGFVAAWTRDTAKLVDMILSLAVIFGKRGPKTVM